MLRLLLLLSVVLSLSFAGRPGPEKTFVRLLKKPQIQAYFEGMNELIVHTSACESLDCDQLPQKIKGKKLRIFGKEDLFMRAFPRAIYVDDVFTEDTGWGVSFHIAEGSGTRERIVYRGTYVR
jgi:hypothetical protein